MSPFPASLRGFKYNVTVVDSLTNYIILINTRTKENISKQLENVILKIKKRYNTNAKCFFSDNGSEFMKMQKFAYSKEINLQMSSNYMPSEKGKIERYNRTVFHSLKALLHQANLNMKFWTFAALYSTLILNYTMRLKLKSAYELITENKLQLKKIVVFGSRGFVKSVRKSKFQANEKAIFLGYDTRSKIMLAYVISNRRLSKIRDTALYEERTLLQNSRSFHKVFQRLNEKVGNESTENIMSSESDTETEKVVKLEENDDTEAGKDRTQKSKFQIENEENRPCSIQ
eukprot:snap_masked-scaffold_3-processed-gene-13.28-mRNA-1 protein AED:1.00 eAED:1.00 QI:0/-1/0/0/-1/1/1/0/286